MTLRDLMAMLRHFWGICLSMALVCGIAGWAYARIFTVPQYSATSELASVDPTGAITSDTLMLAIAPIAESVAQRSAEGVDLTVEGPPSGATLIKQRTLTFRAVGADRDLVIAAVNEAANETAKEAEDFFLQLTEQAKANRNDEWGAILRSLGDSSVRSESILDLLTVNDDYSHCNFAVTEALEATAVAHSGIKYGLVGLLSGLFVSIVVVVGIDFARRPLKNRDEVETLCALPILAWKNEIPAGELLWGNLILTSSAPPRSVALVPLAEGELQGLGGAVLKAADQSEQEGSIASLKGKSNSLLVVECLPLSRSLASVYDARSADAVVICVRLWRDTAPMLADSIRELRLAKANLVGVAVLD